MQPLGEIWVRTRLSVRGTFGAEGKSLELAIDGMIVTVSYEDRPADGAQSAMILEVRSRVPVSSAIVETLEDPTRDEAGTAVSDGVLDCFQELNTKQSSACRRAFELLRWRHRFDAPHSPYSSLGADWSVDGQAWTRAPLRASVLLRPAFGFQLRSQEQAKAQELADRGVMEPVAHQLLREAIDVSQANPRSALVIGIAAIETGFKHLVATLIPGAAWLVENVPSPPLVKMLVNYLPALPVRPEVADGLASPPKYVRQLLAKAIEERNRVAHTGIGSMTAKELGKLLDAAGDLLYFFDYLAGELWAFARTSSEFRAALATERK